MLTPSTKHNYPSISESKISPALTKRNQYQKDQISCFKAPYFNADIQSKMRQRAKKQNLILETQENTQKNNKIDHLGKAGKIVEDLIKKHGMAKQKISKLKQQAAKQTQRQTLYKPQNPIGQKFIFRGSMIERNQVWLQEKKRKQIQRKQEALVNDLEGCTFSPQISSRKISQIYLKNKSKIITEHSHQKQKKCVAAQTPSPLKNKKDISLTQYQTAKKQIKNRLFTLPLKN